MNVANIMYYYPVQNVLEFAYLPTLTFKCKISINIRTGPLALHCIIFKITKHGNARSYLFAVKYGISISIVPLASTILINIPYQTANTQIRSYTCTVIYLNIETLARARAILIRCSNTMSPDRL